MKKFEEEQNLLAKICSPADLKKLPLSQLDELCEQIRKTLVEVVSVNGGHLSSNLGAVELTVMLHYVFSCPSDSIVWDVGHQAYTHKILTGRYNQIKTIRRSGGLSGFPKRGESECDAFDVGHSSTAISAAYGIAQAKQLAGDNSYTLAVVGDGSFTGGLAYEGMNNAGRFKRNFIVILNDNKMSISHNVGAMARYLTGMRIRPGYLKIKQRVERGLHKMPGIGSKIAGGLRHSKSRIKNLVYRNTLFDFLGFTYYGPVNGHDVEGLKKALEAVKKVKGPVLLHVVTTKGKGYKFAENDPKSFHGIGQFDIDSGEVIADKKGFSAQFGQCLCNLASINDNICAITAAMGLGTGLGEFVRQFKKRTFDVGIAEAHAVTFAAGLAAKGLLPVFAVYSTFLQRSYDQILHDAAMQNLHMLLCIDRAGVVGEDGETHQGVFDVLMLNGIPNVTIFSPAYYEGMGSALEESVQNLQGVCAVRYPRGCEGYRPDDYSTESINYDIYGSQKAKVLVVTYGRIFSFAAQAADELKQQKIDVCILKLCRIKPIDQSAIGFASKFKKILFFEESVQNGGIGQSFLMQLAKLDYKGKFVYTGINDEFIPHATVAESLANLGLDKAAIINKIKDNK
ncbi:MAG: 1-deoxy-D-xylulose-5-phosphate synthase [Oscillospiraceae bacterium]|jgi:1-deoxy-D-xylulose-5-phosphate synthase|nr:1-deoxy-D-xylulose-5-phosphate synthase [Oscillospiraceae bacterium]